MIVQSMFNFLQIQTKRIINVIYTGKNSPPLQNIFSCSVGHKRLTVSPLPI